jgi:iron complex outermembrane recepter protein
MKRILLCCASFMAMATSAAAQDVSDRSVPNESSTASESAGIEDIVVTASRRSETTQRSALSIQALSSEALERAHVTRPEDLNALAPGVAIATAGNQPQVYIRGVGNFASNYLAEGAVAFNLDGVYISRATTTRGMFYDLERVEVLKGPQGTLYGRNASGGAINVITAKPKLGETSGFAEAGAGNLSLLQGAAALNIPLGETVAVRASGQVVDRDGYLSDGYEDERTQSARLQLLWQPNPDISLLLNGNYQHVGGMGAGAVLKPQLPGDKFRGAADPAVTAIFLAQPFIGSLLTYPKTDGFIDLDLYAIGAELNWNLGPATLTVIPAYRYSKSSDLTYVPGFPVLHSDTDKQTSVEVRLGNSGAKLKWVLGGYYFNEQVTNPDGPAVATFQGLSTFIENLDYLNTRSYAAFGQATYSVTDRFRVTGGLRYTYEKKTLSDSFQNYSLPQQPPAPPGTCAAAEAEFDLASPYPPRFCRLDVNETGANAGRLTYNNVTFKAGVEFDVAPGSMAYANVSTGFKSGGFFQAPPPNTFRPEKLTSFDAGIKNRFLDNRLQVNAEVFFWRYEDHQETSVGPTAIPGFFTLITVNAGKARSYGADLDVLFRATPHDEIGFKVQYNKAKYDSFEYQYPSAFGLPPTTCAVGPSVNGAQTVDCSGKPMMRAPLWTGTVSYRHDFDLGDHGMIAASADMQFSSASYLATDFLPSERQGAFAVGNFDLNYTTASRRLMVSAFVHNIWNEAVYTQAFRYPYVSGANPLANPDGVILGSLRPPRTFGGRIRVSF